MTLEGTAISLGQVKPSAQAVGSPRPWLGGMAAQGLFGFFLWMFTPHRFLRAAGPLGQKEPLCLVEGQEQRRRGDGWSRVSGGEDGVWSTGEQGLP